MTTAQPQIDDTLATPPRALYRVIENRACPFSRAWDDAKRRVRSWDHTDPFDGDEDYDRPTAKAISTALAVAEDFGDRGEPSPSFVGPTGDGGIEFSLRLLDATIVLEVLPDGSVNQRSVRHPSV